jgi:hypothetical protein
VLLAWERAHLLQHFVILVDTRDRNKIGVLRNEIKPVASPSPDPDVHNGDSHLLSFISKK